MGSHIAQGLVLKYPDKVNKLILYAADCGDKESIQRSPQVEQALTNTTTTIAATSTSTITIVTDISFCTICLTTNVQTSSNSAH